MKSLYILGALLTISQMANAQYTYSRFYDFGVVPIGIQRITLYNDGGASYGVNYNFTAQMAPGSDPAFNLTEAGCRDDGTQILCGATIIFLPTRSARVTGTVKAVSTVRDTYTDITLNLVGTGVIGGPDNPDFKTCDAQRKATCAARGEPARIVPYLLPFTPGQTIEEYYIDYPNAPADREVGSTVSFQYNCLYTNPSFPGEYNYYAGFLGTCSYVVGPKAEDSINLSIPTKPFSASDSQSAGGSFSVKPDKLVDIGVKVNGSGIPDGDSRTAQVKLVVGSDASIPPQSISLSDIKAGKLVKFPYQFSADQAGEVSLQAEIVFAADSNPIDNFSTIGEKMYVLCSVADKGTVVVPLRQNQGVWINDLMGSTRKTIRSKGCYTTSFAMLMNSYKINKSESLAEINPRTVNIGLQQNQGYSSNANFQPIGAVEFARKSYIADCVSKNERPESCVGRSYEKISFINKYDNSAASLKIVNQNLCKGNPVILEVPGITNSAGQHFVLASGIGVSDQGQIEYVVQDPALGEDELYAATKIRGARLFKQIRDPSMLFFHLLGGLNYIVTDPLGRRTGFDPYTNTRYSEIPDSDYSVGEWIASADNANEVPDPANTFQTVNAVDGDYKVQIFGDPSKNVAYQLERFASDAVGNPNGSGVVSGVIIRGQSRVVTSSQVTRVVEKNYSSIVVKEAIFYDKNRKDKAFISGKIVSGNGQQLGKLNTAIKVKVGSYSTIIDPKKFPLMIGRYPQYLLIDWNKGAAAIAINMITGSFDLYFDNINLDDAKPTLNSVISIEFGDVKALGPVTFKDVKRRK